MEGLGQLKTGRYGYSGYVNIFVLLFILIKLSFKGKNSMHLMKYWKQLSVFSPIKGLLILVSSALKNLY